MTFQMGRMLWLVTQGSIYIKLWQHFFAYTFFFLKMQMQLNLKDPLEARDCLIFWEMKFQGNIELRLWCSYFGLLQILSETNK